MKSYHLLTDAADFDEAWMKEHANDVTVIPDHVILTGKDDKTNDLSEFYAKDGQRKLPDADTFYDLQERYLKDGIRITTSAPTQMEIADQVAYWQTRGRDVIYLTMSANLSETTFNNGRNACVELDNPFGKRAVCLDSQCISMGLGYLIELVLENCDDFNDVITFVKAHRSLIAHPFTVFNFSYLRAGGRIGAVAATLGNSLRLKPFMDFKYRKNGKRTLDAVDLSRRNLLVRGEDRLLDKFVQQTEEQIAPSANEIIIVYGKCKSSADRLANKLAVNFPQAKVRTGYRVGATIGVHTGPDILSFFYLRKPPENLNIGTDFDYI